MKNCWVVENDFWAATVNKVVTSGWSTVDPMSHSLSIFTCASFSYMNMCMRIIVQLCEFAKMHICANVQWWRCANLQLFSSANIQMCSKSFHPIRHSLSIFICISFSLMNMCVCAIFSYIFIPELEEKTFVYQEDAKLSDAVRRFSVYRSNAMLP